MRTAVAAVAAILAAAPALARELNAEPARLDPVIAEQAKTLAQEALSDDLGLQIVEDLTTEIGPRLAGTPEEARAREWAVSMFSELGFDNVRVEPFEVFSWRRGEERAEVLAPYPQELVVTALGHSPATPSRGVTGQVVRFATFDDLLAAPLEGYEGKIIFVDDRMNAVTDGAGYGVANRKRSAGSIEGAKREAAAVLIRSVGTSTQRFAHTGVMSRGPEGRAELVPAGALSAPDADQLTRMVERGPVTLKVTLTPRKGGVDPSGNVVAEIVGSQRPEEIVLIGAHLDSWDQATGALDDGAGVGIVVAAAKRVMEFGRPERTVRVVLFGSEEVGLVGARAYMSRHRDDLDNHIVGTESDFGAGRVYKFDTRVGVDMEPLADDIQRVLWTVGVGPGRRDGSGGPDMAFMPSAGVPVVRLYQDGRDYFNYHHTPDDTFDKIDPDDFRQNVAAWTAFVWMIANDDHDLRGENGIPR